MPDVYCQQIVWRPINRPPLVKGKYITVSKTGYWDCLHYDPQENGWTDGECIPVAEKQIHAWAELHIDMNNILYL